MNEKTYIKTGQKEFDEFYPRIKAFLQNDDLEMTIDGKKIRGYRSPDGKSIWIRDHSDIMRGFKYYETDMKSTVEHFAETQASNGRIFDFFTIYPEKLPSEKENWNKYVRVAVEADVEFRFVKAAFLAWQATGDDDWIVKLLPQLEKALNYILTNPWRWDEKTQLVKRPYTVDTWDFAYTAGKHDWLQFQITDDTFWGIMHGDNSGYFEAFQIMALLSDYFGNKNKKEYWSNLAGELQDRMNKVCWNGTFYTHFVKLTPVTIDGVDEAAQLSLSNPMDINRGAATHEMAVSILEEYLRRRESTSAFAEWFSIDPAFPDGIFGDEKIVRGAYCNGGIMPLVGGELARAAFDHGFESYGVDILKRYYNMISREGETFLWYFPDGTHATIRKSTSPDASPTDGWGSSAMLYALLEGLAGIEDKLKLFQKSKISPRWAAADVDEAQVRIAYENSDHGIGYSYQCDDHKVSLDVQAQDSEISFHVLLPEKATAHSVEIDGSGKSFSLNKIEKSVYVDFNHKVENKSNIKINLK
ncbi:MAG: hypothetical protein GWP06_14770 [Actinobacteria bacterium]|nr:hypothetical protein [Actinomycetota bacterium]